MNLGYSSFLRIIVLFALSMPSMALSLELPFGLSTKDPSKAHVVVFLEDGIVDQLEDQEAISIGYANYFRGDHYFRVHPYAQQFIDKLPDDTIFLSSLSSADLAAIYTKLQFKPKMQFISELHYDSIPKSEYFIFIQPVNYYEKLFTKHQQINYQIFKSYNSVDHALEDFHRLTPTLKNIDQMKYYPITQQKWNLDYNRLPIIMAKLQKKLGNPDFQNVPDTRLAIVGKTFLAGYPLAGYRWHPDTTRCEVYDVRNGVAQPREQKDCIKYKVYQAEWQYSADKKSVVSGCKLYTLQSHLFIKDADFQLCINKLPADVYWYGSGQNECAYFTEDTIAKIPMPQAPLSCTSKTKHVITDPKTGVNVVKALNTIPTLENLNRFWSLNTESKYKLIDLKKCKEQELHSIIADEYGNPKYPECLPDTTYSWGDQEKLDVLKTRMGKGKWVTQFRSLFTTRSPIGSHGYGPIPIRLKFKKGVHWKVTEYQNCSRISDQVASTTVYFRRDYFDIVLCSPEVLESWSYGLREHYDEIIREYRFLNCPECTEENCDLYGCVKTKNPFMWNIDDHDFTEPTFWKSMAIFYKTIVANKGELFCNPHVNSSLCTVEQHFKTDAPIYYNNK